MDLTKKIENREKNLIIHYESVRKDLDIVLTSTIPTQKNLMKTILWINATIIGFIATQYNNLPYSIAFIVSISYSAFAILIIIYSLKKGRRKAFGQSNVRDLEKIKQDKFEHIRGINHIMRTTEEAFYRNLSITEERAKYLSGATTATLISLIIIFLYAVVVINIKLR